MSLICLKLIIFLCAAVQMFIPCLCFFFSLVRRILSSSDWFILTWLLLVDVGPLSQKDFGGIPVLSSWLEMPPEPTGKRHNRELCEESPLFFSFLWGCEVRAGSECSGKTCPGFNFPVLRHSFVKTYKSRARHLLKWRGPLAPPAPLLRRLLPRFSHSVLKQLYKRKK